LLCGYIRLNIGIRVGKDAFVGMLKQSLAVEEPPESVN